MTAFDDALADIVNDENVGCDTDYFVGGTGAAKPIRIVLSAPGEDVPFGETRAAVQNIVASVLASDIPEPTTADTLRIKGVTYKVVKILPDATASSFRLTLKKA